MKIFLLFFITFFWVPKIRVESLPCHELVGNTSSPRAAAAAEGASRLRRYIEIFKSNFNEIRSAMSPKMRGPGPMGGAFNRPSPYDSRDRFGGPNRYNMNRGRGSE